jgi:hypothetical protein
MKFDFDQIVGSETGLMEHASLRRESANESSSIDKMDVTRGSRLPDENAQERRYRNGATRLGLQYEKGDQHSGWALVV